MKRYAEIKEMMQQFKVWQEGGCRAKEVYCERSISTNSRRSRARALSVTGVGGPGAGVGADVGEGVGAGVGGGPSRFRGRPSAGNEGTSPVLALSRATTKGALTSRAASLAGARTLAVTGGTSNGSKGPNDSNGAICSNVPASGEDTGGCALCTPPVGFVVLLATSTGCSFVEWMAGSLGVGR